MRVGHVSASSCFILSPMLLSPCRLMHLCACSTGPWCPRHITKTNLGITPYEMVCSSAILIQAIGILVPYPLQSDQSKLKLSLCIMFMCRINCNMYWFWNAEIISLSINSKRVMFRDHGKFVWWTIGTRPLHSIPACQCIGFVQGIDLQTMIDLTESKHKHSGRCIVSTLVYQACVKACTSI